MKIIVGHGNMDLDCVASMVLAKYLYPDHVPIRSHLVHPVARKLMNLYEDRLGFMSSAELKGKTVEHAVVVDARSPERIAEYMKNAGGEFREVEIFDHHPFEGRDIPGALVHEASCGANASALARELQRRNLRIESEDATIALTGIYADTGNFLHENVAMEDFQAASWLLGQGASLKLVKEFLVPLKERYQVTLFHEVLNKLELSLIRGHRVQTCYMELEDDSQGLGSVVERVFEVENGELMFGFFFFPRKAKLLVIARNGNPDIRLNEIFTDLGGGGHRQAASATVKTAEGPELVRGILGYVERMLKPADCARDIMTVDVRTISAGATLMEASIQLETWSHTGAPVVDGSGALVGLLTLRDIMHGRRGNQMGSAVRTFMSKEPIVAAPETTVREIDELLFEHDIGHLPVIDAGALVGIVTRADYLDYARDARKRKDRLLEELGVASAL
ncbi:MAG: hypothetical protein A2001_09320 [Treponema sp. GWC1_61_84]|nr:MAG: hypothetical protein A2001_09320 [Treponema sp. GWC1_61_84]